MYFTYTIRNDLGELIVNKIEAKSIDDALEQLKQKGIFPIDIKKNFFSARNLIAMLLQQHITLSDISLFCSSLATFLKSGTTLSSAIDMLQSDESNKKLSNYLKQVNWDIQKGHTLYYALSKHKVFPPALTETLKVGESVGKIGVILENLSFHYNWETKLFDEIKIMLIYPTVMCMLIIAIIIFCMFFVIPRYALMFDSVGVDFPFATKILITISNFIVQNYVFIILFAFIFLGFFLRWRKTKSGKQFLDYFVIKIPVINDLIITYLNARFSRLFSLLLKSGVKTITALELLLNAFDSYVIRNTMSKVLTKIQQGQNIVDAFNDEIIFKSMFKSMLKVGIESEKLSETMERIAEQFEKELESSTAKLHKAVNVLITLFIGIFVAFLMMALMLPMYDFIRVL